MMKEDRGHEVIEQLLSVAALGGLDPDDDAVLEREMAVHGDCPECRRLRDDYAEVAGRLALTLEPVAVRPGLEEETLRLARGAGSAGGERATHAGGGRLLRGLVAVAAALVLFAGGWIARDLSGSRDGARVALPSTVVPFQGTGQGTGGNLSVAYEPGRAGVYLFGSALQAPPSGMVYEVWMIQGETPVPATCFTPASNGSLFTYLDDELGSTQALAVTVEPATCPAAPTTSPILTAAITRA